MILFSFLFVWWMENNGQDYVSIKGEDINWEINYKNLTGKGIKIVSMADGARLNHKIYENRTIKDEFLNAFYNIQMDNPPEPLSNSESISQGSLGLAAGSSNVFENFSGVAPDALVESYYFYDNNSNHENLQYVICHHVKKWDISILSYQYDYCQGSRFCRYVEPSDFTQKMVSECLYEAPSEQQKIFVVPVEHYLSSDVIFSPPARWPMMFTIAGTNNRGLPLDHGSEGSGVFMSCPVADRAPIPSSNVLSDTGYMTNFTSPNASAAIFAGGLAVLLEQNKHYTIPDLMFLTALTADQTQPDSVLWSDNSFGLNFSRRQGFGRLNLKKAVDLGEKWESVGGFYNISRFQYDLSDEIGSTNYTFDFGDVDPEWTCLSVQLSMTGRQIGFGSLNPHVYSPGETDCEMKILSESDNELIISEIELPSYKFLGDKVKGTWTVEFKHIDNASNGTITSLGLTIFYSKKGPDRSLINQSRKANPYTPLDSNGFKFNVTETDMYATENWSVGVTYHENIRNSSYILMFLQSEDNTTRVKIKSKFNSDFTSITLNYVPSVFTDGLPMYFVVESLDETKPFTALLPVKYHNNFTTGIILFEAADNDNCVPTDYNLTTNLTATNIPIDKKCIVAYYALNLTRITDDGYSSSVTQSIITGESKTILNRAFSRNLGMIQWEDSIPSNRDFLFQLSPTSSGRMEQFSPLTIHVHILPHDGLYKPTVSGFKIGWLVVIIICFAANIGFVVLQIVGLIRRRFLLDDQNPLIRSH